MSLSNLSERFNEEKGFIQFGGGVKMSDDSCWRNSTQGASDIAAVGTADATIEAGRKRNMCKFKEFPKLHNSKYGSITHFKYLDARRRRGAQDSKSSDSRDERQGRN